MAGVHQTLREVRSLYEAMTGSAERAKRAVERVEGFEKQVERLAHTADKNARIREARLKAAYERLESLVDHESRLVFWFSRTWIFLLALMCAGFMGATAYHLARTFTRWVERAISSWWAG